MSYSLPEGWTIQPTRFLFKLVDPAGKDILFGLTEEACAECLYCLPEFGGVVGSEKAVDSFVDL